MMKTIIKGQNYNFCVIVDEMKFCIKALHLASLRFSFINNLNAVLSEFNIKVDDKKISESQWFVSKKKCSYFFKKAKEFLLCRNTRNYIEKKLDEDRKYGEWENIEILKN